MTVRWTPQDRRHGLKLRSALRRLEVDALTVQATAALAREEVRAILLKGRAIADWLYDANEVRPYVDCDLLIDPAQLEVAGRALRGLGLQRLIDDTMLPAFAEPHAVTWGGQKGRASVDLHWRIPGIAADPKRAWRRLSADTAQITLARGVHAEVLGEPARALHLALHGIQNGREATKSIEDLTRGLTRVSDAAWKAAASLAGELEAIEPFAAGLRLVPPGAELADRLELPRTAGMRWALSAQTPPPGAMRMHEFAGARGLMAKLRYVATALLPPPSYVRALYPEARRSTWALVAAYVRRPLAAVRAAPAAWRALRRARSRAQGSGSDT